MIFFLFFTEETGFNISCKFSRVQTNCLKCQNLFCGENKNISVCRLLKILPRILSVELIYLETVGYAQDNVSRAMRKRIFRHKRTAKAQISLRIQAV